MVKEPRSDRVGRTFAWVLALGGMTALFIGGYALYRGTGADVAGPGEDVPGGREATVAEVEDRWGTSRADREPAASQGAAIGEVEAGGPTVTSLAPVLGSDWERYVGAPVRLEDLQVERVDGRLLRVRAGADEVLVLVEQTPEPSVASGQVIRVVDGSVQPVRVLDDAGFGGEVDDVGADVFIRAERVSVTG